MTISVASKSKTQARLRSMRRSRVIQPIGFGADSDPPTARWRSDQSVMSQATSAAQALAMISARSRTARLSGELW